MKLSAAAFIGLLMMLAAQAAMASGGLELATEWSWARDGGRIINSLVVVLGVIYIVAKYAGPALKKRATDIRNEIQELVEARQMAEQNVADYKKKLEAIKAEHEKAMADAKAEAESIRTKIIEQARLAAEANLSRAAEQIEVETEQARQKLRKETTLLAIAAAEELLKKNISPSDHKDLLNDYISRMEKSN